MGVSEWGSLTSVGRLPPSFGLFWESFWSLLAAFGRERLGEANLEGSKAKGTVVVLVVRVVLWHHADTMEGTLCCVEVQMYRGSSRRSVTTGKELARESHSKGGPCARPCVMPCKRLVRGSILRPG